MKKYSPSVKSNNQLREKAVAEVKALIYKLERGRYDSDLAQDAVLSLIADLKENVDSLENTVGLGTENIYGCYERIMELTKELKKLFGQNMVHRIEETISELDFNVGMWRDVLEGDTYMPDDEDVKAIRVSYARKKLNQRLSELMDIKEGFTASSKRLEKEIVGYEKDLKELDNLMLKEDNERKINDLFKKINALKNKMDTLVVRQSNYQSCFNLLDMIYTNANEIVEASDFAGEEIGKAKALLNIGRLKNVLSEPDKALSILKRMQAEIKEIAGRVQNMDEKMDAVSMHTTVVSGDALAYKEELMRRKREKEQNSEEIKITPRDIFNSTEQIEEENH